MIAARGQARARARGAPRTQPAGHAARGARAPARDLRVLARQRRRRHGGVAPCLTASTACDLPRRRSGFVFDVDGTLATAARTGAPSRRPARSRCSSGSAHRDGDRCCSRTAATSVRRRWRAPARGRPAGRRRRAADPGRERDHLHPPAPSRPAGAAVRLRGGPRADGRGRHPRGQGEEAEVVFVAHVDDADLPSWSVRRARSSGRAAADRQLRAGLRGRERIIFSRGAMVDRGDRQGDGDTATDRRQALARRGRGDPHPARHRRRTRSP